MGKRLAIVTEDYISGGSCVVANQLARHLHEWDVVVFINRAYDDRILVRDLDAQRIRIVRYQWKTLADFGSVAAKLRKSGHTLVAWFLRSFNLAIRYPHILLSAVYLAQLFKDYRIDFVLSNNGGYPGGEMCRAAVLGARLRRIEALMIVHNMPTSPPAVLRPIEKILDQLVGRCAEIVCVSKAVADALTRCRFLGIHPAVIENAVEKPSVEPVVRADCAITDILCIGSISPIKDQIKAVHVYRMLINRLKASRPDLPVPVLTVMGPVADQDYFEELIKVIEGGKIEDERVVLLGYGDPQRYFARTGQVLLITSNREGLPVVLLEAMSHGIPAVSTDAGGVSDAIIQGVNGEIRPIEDLDGLAQSLWRYVTDPNAYLNASKQCIATFKARYSIHCWIDKYRRRITNACDALRAPRKKQA